MIAGRQRPKIQILSAALGALLFCAAAVGDIIFMNGFERFVPDEAGATTVFFWRMNEASGTTYADYGPNDKPMFSDGSPNHTDPDFGPYSTVRDPNGDEADTAVFSIDGVSWPSDRIWIHWWMRPQNSANWGGGTNQDMVKLYANVYSPPRVWHIRKNGADINYRFHFQGGQTGAQSISLAGYDPTTFHLFSVYYDGTTGDHGIWVDTTHVLDLNTGTTGALNFGIGGTEGMHIRTKQNDCLMFDVHIKNDAPSLEKVQAVFDRYTDS